VLGRLACAGRARARKRAAFRSKPIRSAAPVLRQDGCESLRVCGRTRRDAFRLRVAFHVGYDMADRQLIAGTIRDAVAKQAGLPETISLFVLADAFRRPAKLQSVPAVTGRRATVITYVVTKKLFVSRSSFGDTVTLTARNGAILRIGDGRGYTIDDLAVAGDALRGRPVGHSAARRHRRRHTHSIVGGLGGGSSTRRVCALALISCGDSGLPRGNVDSEIVARLAPDVPFFPLWRACLSARMARRLTPVSLSDVLGRRARARSVFPGPTGEPSSRRLKELTLVKRASAKMEVFCRGLRAERSATGGGDRVVFRTSPRLLSSRSIVDAQQRRG